MPDIHVSAAFAAVFLAALIPLTVQVGIKRIQTGILFGDGGDAALARRRAAQSNYLDHVPIFLLALALSELGGAPAWLLLGAGGAMVVGRSLHAWCMLATSGSGISRAAGMVLTLASHLALAIFLGWRVLQI
jgi:hypothetical protein